MIETTPFYCVNRLVSTSRLTLLSFLFVFCFPVLGYTEQKESPFSFRGSEPVQYETRLTTHSTMKIGGTPFEVLATQRLGGVFQLLENQTFQLPLSAQFQIEEVQFTERHLWDSSFEDYNLDRPGPVLELNELKALRGRPIPFTLVKAPPFIAFSQEFLDIYQGLQIIQYSFFAGLLGEDLSNLFEIADRLVHPEESIQITYEKTPERAFRTTKTFTLKEITAQHIIVETVTTMERQKIFISESEEAVVDGHFHATWTLDKNNCLLFRLQETGEFSQTVSVGGVENRMVHSLEKQIVTTLPP